MRDTMGDLHHDVRYAFRSLGRARGFSLVVILSLAVGVGVITASLTGLDAVWLKPVPGVPDEDVITEIVLGGESWERNEWSMAEFWAAKEADTPLQMLAGWLESSASLRTAEGGYRVPVAYVSAEFFDVLGIVPSMGRMFRGEENTGPGQHPVAVISHDLWLNKLGARDDVIGSSLLLDRVPYTIIGIAPEDFRGHRPNNSITDVWVPLVQIPDLMEAGALFDDQAHYVRVLGRLGSGETVEATTVALRTVFERLETSYYGEDDPHIPRAATFGRFPAQGRSGDAMGMGMIIALLLVLLLIICGNLAGMVLARSASRERELAVRLALGSQRSRMVRQLMVEALVLAAVGGTLGIAASYYGMRSISPAFMGIVTPGAVFEPSAAILVVSFGIALATTLAFGLGPAFRFSRPELVGSLKDDSGVGGRRVGRVHRLATASQTGFALFSVVLGGLFLRTLAATEAVDVGFQTEGLVAASLDLSGEGFTDATDAMAFVERVRSAVASRPGVRSVAIGDGMPRDGSWKQIQASRADRAAEDQGAIVVERTRADPNYFGTLGIPIEQGRAFTAGDDLAGERVAIVSAGLAQRLWPGESVVGQTIRLGRDNMTVHTIVGVAADVAASRPRLDWDHLYVPLAQNYRGYLMLVARGPGEMSATVSAVRSGVLEADPLMPIPGMRTAVAIVERSNQAERGAARVGVVLAALTLILAAIGVYGVVALTVANRTREIGLRMALGASRGEVQWSVLGDAIRLVVPGLVVGALVAVVLALVMRSTLFGVTPVDPVSFGVGGALLIAVVLSASLVPARRASGVDPVEALRAE